MEKNSATQSLGLRDICSPNPICPHWVNPTSLSTQGFKPFKGCLFGWLMAKILPLSAWWSNWCPLLLRHLRHKQQDQYVVLFILHVVSNPYLLIYQKKLVASSPGLMPSLHAASNIFPKHTNKHTHTQSHIRTNTHHNGTDCSCYLFVNLCFRPRPVIQLNAGSLSQPSNQL